MILVRGFFWLCVILLLVPANQFAVAQQQVYAYAPIVMSAVGQKVATTFFDMTDTCADRPDICQAAQDLFVAKSQDESGPPRAAIDIVVPAGHDERI